MSLDARPPAPTTIEGGAATVTREVDPTGRAIAVKRARPDAASRAALEREAEALAGLDHPRIVRLLGRRDGALELAWIDGASLAELGAGGRLPAPVAARILLDACEGLAHAHARGLAHGDVAPDNILVGMDGGARLVDFGLARRFPTAADGPVFGRPGYAAPERLRGVIDARTDVFAVAVTAWEALAGRRLWEGDDAEVSLRAQRDDAPSLASVEPLLAVFDDALAQATRKRADERTGSVEDLARALEDAARTAEGLATHDEVAALVRDRAARARPPTPPPPSSEPARPAGPARSSLALAAVAASALALAAIVAARGAASPSPSPPAAPSPPPASAPPPQPRDTAAAPSAGAPSAAPSTSGEALEKAAPATSPSARGAPRWGPALPNPYRR